MIDSLKHCRKVIVPWSFSELSRAVLERTLDMVASPECVRVLHVVPPLTGPENGVPYASSVKQKCRALEQRFRGQFRLDSRIRQTRFHIEYGRLGPEICRFAKRYHADAIVMPQGHRQGLSRLLFGGTSEYVVVHCNVPVLVFDHSDLPINNRRSSGGPFFASLSRWMGTSPAELS